ncbi:MAG: enoyl-CoA hydratase-related protein [Hyphomicrobiales bacterium]|nr:enoyl-CoA hydratase-related protein [Hyphomicrobiales bacterium]
MSEADIRVEIRERSSGARVAWVTVDRQDRLNALDTAQARRLAAAFDGLAGDGALKAVVLTGAGAKAFVGGADLGELGQLDPASARQFITDLHLACAAIRACPVPVIGRIDGYCLGAGLEVAASCDMRAASDTAVFGMPEVHVGLPSVIEAALLPGLIGWGRTREILLTGRTFGADEALAMGLVERVAPAAALDGAVDAWLDAICAAAPQAVRSQKALIGRWEEVSLQDGILAGVDALAAAYETDEPRTRVAAFFEARAAAKRR